MSDYTKIDKCIKKHGLTVESEFVPFSKSRNAAEKIPSLNWKVTLKHNGQKILTTDYSAGCAHAPSYNAKGVDVSRIWGHRVIMWECENGRELTKNDLHFLENYSRVGENPKRKPILPEARDVIYSLLMDAEVLDYPVYEDWAGCFGYDPDSRSGEKVYQACMKIALQFRQVGESVISELREVFQDY